MDFRESGLSGSAFCCFRPAAGRYAEAYRVRGSATVRDISTGAFGIDACEAGFGRRESNGDQEE
jgi:hypothetical protein